MSNELTTIDQNELQPIGDHVAKKATSVSDILLDVKLNEGLMLAAEHYAKGGVMVPDTFAGNVHACFVALHVASMLDVNPLALMSKCYEVNGRAGIEATFLVALFGRQTGQKIRYEYSGEGDGRKCNAWTLDADGERCEAEVSIKMAKEFGWYIKKGSMWPKMPDQMLAYRSAAFLIRRHFPETLFGMRTVDELMDEQPTVKIKTSKTVCQLMCDDSEEEKEDAKNAVDDVTKQMSSDEYRFLSDEILGQTDLDGRLAVFDEIQRSTLLSDADREKLRAQCTAKKEKENWG